jgi:hypothetical protein
VTSSGLEAVLEAFEYIIVRYECVIARQGRTCNASSAAESGSELTDRIQACFDVAVTPSSAVSNTSVTIACIAGIASRPGLGMVVDNGHVFACAVLPMFVAVTAVQPCRTHFFATRCSLQAFLDLSPQVRPDETALIACLQQSTPSSCCCRCTLLFEIDKML